MRSLVFTLLVLGALVALLYPFFMGAQYGEPAPDYPTDAEILNKDGLKPPPHTMEEINKQYKDSLTH